MLETLTIGIPTYNRSAELLECLYSIDASLKCIEGAEAGSLITVIVSDNASTDETENVLAAHRNIFPWMRYHRNEKNLGAEGNFYQLVEQANSTYVWLLGDDDRMMPNALPAVVSRLGAGFDLLICNCSTYTRGFAAQRSARHFTMPTDLYFDDPNDIMRIFGAYLGYISILVIRKDRFLVAPRAEYFEFAEYGHSVMYALYAGLKPQSCTLYVAEPLIRSQGDNSSGYDWFKYFAVGTGRVLDALKRYGYSPQAILSGKHQVLRDSVLPRALSLRRDGHSTRRVLPLLLPLYFRNWLFWAVGLPGLLLPSFVLRGLDSLLMSRRRLISAGPLAQSEDKRY